MVFVNVSRHDLRVLPKSNLHGSIVNYFGHDSKIAIEFLTYLDNRHPLTANRKDGSPCFLGTNPSALVISASSTV
jgi:hypothetical protein